MRGKAVWKRLLAMVLTAAMVLTGMNLTALDASAAFYDFNNDGDDEEFGLLFCPVWEDGGSWHYEGNDEPGTRIVSGERIVSFIKEGGVRTPAVSAGINWRGKTTMWMPGQELDFIYYDGEYSRELNSGDLRVTYYRENQVLPRYDGEVDPRDPECIKQAGSTVQNVLSYDQKTGYWNFSTYNPGWYVISIEDNMSSYDPGFVVTADGWCRKFDEGAYTVYKREVSAVIHVILPQVAFFSSTEISVDHLYRNDAPQTLDFVNEPEENNKYYLYFENEFDFYEPKNAQDGWGGFELWGDDLFLKGDLENGIEGFFTAKKIEVGKSANYSLYEIEFDENMKCEKFGLRARCQHKEDAGNTPEACLEFNVTPKPYNALYVQWPDRDDNGEVLLTENGQPACGKWIQDEQDFERDEDGNIVLYPKDLWKVMGVDFNGAAIWLGYYDAAKDVYTTIEDPELLSVDYYKSRDDYYDGKPADHAKIEAFYPARDKNTIYFYPEYSIGYYVVSYKNDPSVKVCIEANCPGAALYSEQEATRENYIDAQHIKLISAYPETFKLGLFESEWGRPQNEDQDREVYANISKVELRVWEGDLPEKQKTFSFNQTTGTIVQPSDAPITALKASDYIKISYADNGGFSDRQPNWYNVQLKTVWNTTYEAKIFFTMMSGEEREFFIHVDVRDEGQLNVYSDQSDDPDSFLWDGYNFRAINPVPLKLRFMKMVLENGYGRAMEVPVSDEELKTLKLYSKFKVVKNQEDGFYDFVYLEEVDAEKPDPKYASMKILGDGWIELMLMQQSKEWVLFSQELNGGFRFENSQPAIGFFTSDTRPDVMYGMKEPLTEWIGDEETVTEIAGKKTTKPAAKYIWVWSDPTNGLSAMPDKTKIFVDGKEDVKDYVLSTGKVQTGKNLYNRDRINYSGYSVELTDQAAEDYTLIVETEKYKYNYRWFGDVDSLVARINSDEESFLDWHGWFADQGIEVFNEEALRNAMSTTTLYTPSEDGTKMVETTTGIGQNNLFVCWDEVEDQNWLHEQYRYDVHVKRFADIKVTAPGKSTYTEGDTYDKTGLKVMAYFDDASIPQVDVTSYVKIPAAPLKTSDKKVTVSYEALGGTFTADLAVTVSAKTTAASPAKKGELVQVAAGSAGAGGKYRVAEAGSDAKPGTVIFEGVNDTVSGAFTIPATIKGVDGVEYQVVEIAAGAFKNNTKLTSVTIGDNVTVIGAEAFAGAKNITSVTVGKSVAKIGKKAFAKCAKLKSVKFKGTALKEIGDSAFSDTKALKSMDLSKQKLQKLGKNAFAGSGMKTLKIYVNAVKNIGKGALKNVGGKKKVKVVVFAKDNKIYKKWKGKLAKGKGKSKLKFSLKKKK